MNPDRYRGGRDPGEDDGNRLVIDLRTPPGALSRSDLRRLHEQLDYELLTRQSLDDPGPGTADPGNRSPGRRERVENPTQLIDGGGARPADRSDGRRDRPGSTASTYGRERVAGPPPGRDKAADQRPERRPQRRPEPERADSYRAEPDSYRAEPDWPPPRRPDHRPEPNRNTQSSSQPRPERRAELERERQLEYERERAVGYRSEPARPAERDSGRGTGSYRAERERAPERAPERRPDSRPERRPDSRPERRPDSRPERQRPAGYRPERQRSADRPPERGRGGGRTGQAARFASGGRAGARTAASKTVGSRAPLLVRTTIVVGLIAALAASLDRADLTGGQGESPTTDTTAGTAAGQVQVTASAQPASTANPDGTTAPCNISYSVTPETADRFTVVMVISNTSRKKINGWTLRWDFPPTQKIFYGWNAMVTNGTGGATATGIGADQVIAPGANVTIGFAGQRGAWVPTLTGFTLNGQTCQWKPITGGTGSSAAPTP